MPTPSADTLAELQEKRDALRARLADLTKPAEPGANIGFGKRIGDGTTAAIAHMEDASSAQALARTLADVERALEKADEGTYGCCDACGEAIAPGRLEFRPWSTHCLTHADATPRR